MKCWTDSNWRAVASSCCCVLGIVSAVFTLAVSLTLSVAELQHRARPPLDLAWADPLLAAARAGGGDAGDAAQALSQLDLLARQAYFQHVFFRERGLLLLLGGLLCAVFAFGVWGWLTRTPADPRTFGGPVQPARWRWAQAKVLLAASALGLLFAVLVRFAPSAGPDGATPVTASPAADGRIGDPAPDLEFSPPRSPSWPLFRGFRNDGVADAEGPSPEALQRAVPRWKTPLARPGFSSPVVWEQRIFLTAGDAGSREVLAFDLDNGELLWTREVPFGAAPGTPLPEVTDDTGFAAATPAADAWNVYAIFATGDLVAIDHEGVIRWQRHLGVPDNPYGHASSLVAHEGIVLVQYDHGDRGRLLAIRGVDGSSAWEVARDANHSWASPSLLTAGEQTTLLLHAPDHLAAYELGRGRELWSAKGVSGEVAPSAAIAEGRVFLAQEYSRLVAFGLGADPPAELWEGYEDLPDISSPVAGLGRLWLASSYGAVSCHEAATGELLWRHEYDEGFNASPLLAGDRLYLVDLEGTLRVLGTGEVHEELAVIELGDACYATPALLGERILLRTKSWLLCLP